MHTDAGQRAGRVAICTRASDGTGAATAKALAAEGAAVALAARDEGALAEVAGEIERAGGRALAVSVDVTDEDAVKQLVEATTAAFGRLDLAVNNAGGSGQAPTPLAEVATSDFDSALALNLHGVSIALKHEIPAMLATGGGSIVNMASTAGVDAVAGLAGYVSAKHGLVGLTKVAALDYADQGVRVNALAPGPILTERLQRTVRLVKADVMDADAIAPALADADTVVSALSGPGRAASSVLSESTRSIVQAMREASVRRYIAITGSMLDTTGDGPFFRYIGKPIARRVLKGSARDMRRAEQLIHESGLDWTIIRVPRLTDKPAHGRYRIAFERNVPREFSLPRADLAACTLAVLADDATIRRHVFAAQ